MNSEPLRLESCCGLRRAVEALTALPRPPAPTHRSVRYTQYKHQVEKLQAFDESSTHLDPDSRERADIEDIRGGNGSGSMAKMTTSSPADGEKLANLLQNVWRDVRPARPSHPSSHTRPARLL